MVSKKAVDKTGGCCKIAQTKVCVRQSCGKSFQTSFHFSPQFSFLPFFFFYLIIVVKFTSKNVAASEAYKQVGEIILLLLDIETHPGYKITPVPWMWLYENSPL